MHMTSKRLFGATLKVLGLALALAGVGVGTSAEATCTPKGIFFDNQYQNSAMLFTYRGNWTHSTAFPQSINSSISWSNDAAQVPGAVMNYLEPTSSVSFQINCAWAFDYYYTRAWNRGYVYITAQNQRTGQWSILAHFDLYASTQQFGVSTRITLPTTDLYIVHIFNFNGERRPEATGNFYDLDGIVAR